MNIKVYITEKIKNKNEIAAYKEYEKRLSRYCKISLVTIKSIEELNDVKSKVYKILLNSNGQTLSSEDLAEKINHLGLTGKSDIAFMLVDECACDEHLALSKMDLGTGIATTVLYEQIYRAYRIMRNEPYHK